MDLANLAPAVGPGLVRRVNTRAPAERGPNPFLDNGWLQASYDTGKDYFVTVDGGWEPSVIKKGPQRGEPTERLSGDAAEVVKLIRDAADKLNIGVAIQYSIPTRKVKGNEVDIAGKVTIHYLGKRRKERRQTQVVRVPETSPVA